jgi:very-long-chain ceramide synthase
MFPYDAPGWMPSYLVPFTTLSYPTSPPTNPDSFINSTYYSYGYLDLCFMVSIIAIMAVLRDALRLGVFEPFASWKLNRDLRLRTKALANANGNGTNGKVSNGNGHGPTKSLVGTAQQRRKIHRTVLRFAEQGWQTTYYPCQWLFGLVREYLPPISLIC